jgi:CHAT domain-containing protein
VRRIINLLIVLPLLSWPSAAANTRLRPSAPAQAGDAAPSDGVKEFAAKLVAAATEEERASLLEGEKSLVTEKLTRALLMQARSFYERGDTERNMAALLLAQRVAEFAGDRLGLAQTLTSIGSAYRLRGKNLLALEHLQKALPLHETLGNKPGVFHTLYNMVVVNSFQGDYDHALLRKLSMLAEESGNKEWVAMSLSQYGVSHWSRGEYSLALDTHQESLELYESLGNKFGVAFALHGIGNVYRAYGADDQSLDFFQRSLTLSEEIRSADLSVRTLSNIGALYRAQNDYARAKEYIQKSARLSEVLGNTFWLALSLVNLGEINRLEGNYPQALVLLQRAVSLGEASEYKDPLAWALGCTGAVLLAQGQHANALEAAARATAVSVQTGNRDALWRAHLVAGKAHRALDQPDQALREFERAISVIESVRAGITSNEARSSYFATSREPYDQYVDLLMQLHKRRPAEGHDAAALRASEGARARSLLDLLMEARVDIRRGADFDLLERERLLQKALNRKAEQQTRLLSGKHTDEQAAAAKREIDEVATKLQEARAQIRLKSPHYAALTQPASLGVKEIQALLDKDTLLLEYALGGERSYLWAVTPTSVESFELPGRNEIEKAVRGVYELLSDGRKWEEGGDGTAARYAEEAGRLSRVLLGPVASQLKGRRLVVVGDGALQYLPFGALPLPGAGASRPLVAENEVVSLPSASTVAVLRLKGAGRARASKGVAVIADPVFEPDDERLAGVVTRSTGAGSGREQAAFARRQLERTLNARERAGRDGRVISRLAFTRREAEAIVANAPAGDALKAMDFDASRETATSPRLSDYRLVHFATHGVLDSERPELSGLVFSLVDRTGKPVDGFLRLHEIYNLDLPADLVVLSACQTALGKEIRGEGLVGLTRGFMYAGSPRVVASLWKVNDAATAALMGRFYRGMLKEKMRPAAALRAAQVDMLKQRRWQAPYYWAAFQLQGEWR